MPKTRLFGAKSCSERHGHARRQTERTMPPPRWNPDITGPSVFSNIPHVHRIDPKTGLKWNASWGAGRTAALLPPKRGVFHMKAVPRELNAPHTRPGLRRSASGIILGRAPQAHQGASWATPSSSSSFSRSTNPSTSTEWSQIRSDWISWAPTTRALGPRSSPGIVARSALRCKVWHRMGADVYELACEGVTPLRQDRPA